MVLSSGEMEKWIYFIHKIEKVGFETKETEKVLCGI
jgi:hypothetical protein